MAQKNVGGDMLTDNIFVIGGQVSGSSFIGRKRLLEKYRNDFIASDKRRVYSLVGLSRSGKTSFIKEVFKDRIPDGVFYCYQDIAMCNSYFSIWYSLCRELEDFLDLLEPDSSKQKIYDRVSELVRGITGSQASPDFSDSLVWEKFQTDIRKVFRFLKKLGIRSILVFDEFDRAMDLFTLGTPQYTLFRTLFSDGDMDVSAVTISRRKMETIEGKIYQSSTLANVMDFKPFKGFDDDDMDEYFSVFQTGYAHALSSQDKDRIRYYAGNLPYLLSIIGYYVADDLLDHKVIDIERIFADKCPTVKKYYESCIEQFEREEYLKKIIPYVIGPKYGVTSLDMQVLESLGYLSVSLDERYICISQYFCTMLSAQMLKLDIWSEIINLEKRLKALLKLEAPKIVRANRIRFDSVNEIEFEILRSFGRLGKKEQESLERFIGSGNSTAFSVMSMKRTVKTIAALWDSNFRKYFDDRNFDEYEPMLSKCYEARNPIAHGHEDEVLTDADKNVIDSYCKEIFDVLRVKFPQSTPIPAEETLLKICRETDSDIQA